MNSSSCSAEYAERALRRSEKLQALGTLAGGIAHDFNNILGAIVGYGELAQQHAPEGSALQRYLDNIMHAAGRARALTDRILAFSRAGLAERVPVDIQAVVSETLELLQAPLSPNIRLERELSAAGAAVIGDETRNCCAAEMLPVLRSRQSATARYRSVHQQDPNKRSHCYNWNAVPTLQQRRGDRADVE